MLSRGTTQRIVADHPPEPLLASAGQVAALSTGILHSASSHSNPNAPPRRVLLLEFTAASVEMGLPPDLAALKLAYDAKANSLHKQPAVACHSILMILHTSLTDCL